MSYKNTGTASSPSLELQEENNYYPFGLKHKGYNYNQNGRDHKHGFGGKEEQDDDIAGTQLDWLDFGARNYDASIGRWMNMDPVSEFYYDSSSFNYGGNNPISNIDPNGLWIVNIISSTNSNGDTSYALRFVAEEGDDLNSLSKQLGIDVEDILSVHPELKDKSISEGDSFGLGNIREVEDINNNINTVAGNQDTWNCANLAGGTCSSIKSQWDNPNNNNIEDFANELRNDYTSVSERASRIGTIIHFKLNGSATPKLKKMYLSQIKQGLKDQGKTDAEINVILKDPSVQTLIDNMAKSTTADERHFAIVVLKNKSGTGVQNIIQKSGNKHFKFTVDDIKDVGNTLPYEAKPIGGTNNPYYNKNN